MKLCECGCGEEIVGRPHKRFVSNTHWMRADRRRNIAKYRARERAWKAQNPEYMADYLREYTRANRERIDELKREWNKNNPERRAAIVRRYKRRASAARVIAYMEENYGEV